MGVALITRMEFVLKLASLEIGLREMVPSFLFILLLSAFFFFCFFGANNIFERRFSL